MKAILEGIILAESEQTIEIDGYYYFPKAEVKMSYLLESNHRSMCPYKGIANYFHAQIGSARFENIAWTYPNCKEAVRRIQNYVAFWHEVEVS